MYLTRTKNFDTFNYQHYLARYNIYSICYYPKIQVKKEETKQYRNTLEHVSTGAMRILYYLKDNVSERIQRFVHEPYASFLAGLIIGERRGIDPKLMELFNATGTTHIIAVSGYNITIIVRVLFFYYSKYIYQEDVQFGLCI